MTDAPIRKKLRHESDMLDCFLKARCAQTLASRRVKE